MDASGGGSAGSRDKKNDNQIPKKEEQPYHLTFHQEVKLKVFFESCPQPNEAHCVQLAKELGIESEKIKLWFQNQSQAKVLNTFNTQSFLVLNKEAAAAQEKTRMLEIVGDAMDEMVRLINDKTLWRPLYGVSGFVLVSSRKDDHMNQLLHPHEESSKCTLLVRCRGRQLVDLILDSVEWDNTFPTIVSKAETVAVVNVGIPENRHGALLVMYEKVLILSPLVPSREFLFLRYCRQVENGVWMIVDVSIDSFQEHLSTYPSHKYLSGCMIREMSDEKCEVTCIEHELVEGSSRGVRLYGNVLHDFNTFGAKRLLFALQRKCEKNHCSSFEYIPTHAKDKEMGPQAVRKNLVELSNRMIKSFRRTLNKDNMIPYTELVGDIIDPYGIQLTLCSNEINHSDGKVMCAVATIHLPFPPQTVFYFLTNETRRHGVHKIYN